MKILFITEVNPDVEKGGGKQCSLRNYSALQEVAGFKNVDFFSIKKYNNRTQSIAARIIQLVKMKLGNMYYICIPHIINLIEQNNYTDVFFDRSTMGYIAKSVRERFPHLRILSFFHNVEIDYFTASTSSDLYLKKKYFLRKIYKSEKLIVQKSDILITLTKNDSDRIKELYGRDSDALLPISIKDAMKNANTDRLNSNKEALFVGSYFFGNVEGLTWFCKEVMPELSNIHLTIVGAGMEKLKKELHVSDNITIHSFVEDLSSYYDNADFILLPIISGGGMKVKTAESLMYGKFIVGTSESLRGYNIDKSVACICDTKDDFVNTLSSLHLYKKFNQNSRNLYLAEYSFESSVLILKRLLQND